VLSTAIGMLNLFPIPPLDGGQLLFFSYEAITGRPANESLVRFLMMAGLASILALMVFGVSNDLLCP
jgi:regulator of sigma E protease